MCGCRQALRRGDGWEQYGTRTNIMANTPTRKMQDPTEAALSAIQDALSMRDGESSAPPEPKPEPPGIDLGDRLREGRRRSRRDSAKDQEIFFSEPAIADPEAADEPQPPAANDD